MLVDCILRLKLLQRFNHALRRLFEDLGEQFESVPTTMAEHQELEDKNSNR